MPSGAKNSNDPDLIGTWHLVAFESEDQATGARRPMFGTMPKGRLVLLENGVMIALLTAEGRNNPKTDEERAKAFNTMVAYSGQFRAEGGRFSTDVDVSWNESWVGTEQVRSYSFVGSKLQLISAWGPSAIDPNVIGRGVLEWEHEG